MLPIDEQIRECSTCVHKDKKWYENPCFRCGVENDYFWYEEKIQLNKNTKEL